MQIQNIKRVLVFNEDAGGHQLTLPELATKFGFEPDGTNMYYGANNVNLGNFQKTGKALGDSHRDVIDALQAALMASASPEKTLVFGFEPTQTPKPYEFLAGHSGFIKQLAVELNGEQQRATDAGKTLRIAIRFASEMNDKAQPQSGDPAGYRGGFAQVRTIFKDAAPGVQFSFSPALRADLPESEIGQYWPGDEYVDIIGGTWYIGSPDQRTASLQNMQRYFIHRKDAGRAFAFSEVGGCNADHTGNDAVLQDMITQARALEVEGITFDYATMFLQSKWATDATLAFLRPDSATA